MGSGKATIVAGGWYGDEGKGKIVSYLARDFRHIARAGVGTNAGHTVFFNGQRYPLRMITSGFTNPHAMLYVGKGVLVNPEVLLDEIEKCRIRGRFGVDRLCPVIEKRHIDEDANGYNRESVGSTGSGCGPCQRERVSRSQELRFAKDVKELKPYLTDVSSALLDAMDSGEQVLVEMTQGTMLSLYGFEVDGSLTFYNATTKDTTAGTACADAGIGPTDVSSVVVVYKAIPSRVGQGTFPGELAEEQQQHLHSRGKGEYGTVTGRPRRLGCWNNEVYQWARRTARMNGATHLAITKIDAAFDGNAGKRRYEDMTPEAQRFIEAIEDRIGIPVALIGTGPDTYDIIDRR